MDYAIAVEAPNQLSPLARSLDETNTLLDRLDESIGMLRSKLEPLLNPSDVPNAPGSPEPKASPMGSTVVLRLADQHDTIRRLNRRVTGLMNELEV